MLTNEESYSETLARESDESEREQAYSNLHEEFTKFYESFDFRTKASDGYSLGDVIDCEIIDMDDVYQALMSNDARDAFVKKCIHLHCLKG